VHDVLVGDVGVREDDLVDVVLRDHRLELVLGDDRDPVRVAVAGQGGRVEPALDVRDLRGRERNNLVIGAVAVDEVEVVEVPARGSCNDYPSPAHA
jgi:hypothetical protein